VKVSGLLAPHTRHVGRLASSWPILGVPEEVETVLDKLEVHGIAIDRIVVTQTWQSLSSPAREALFRVERSRGISLQFLTEDLGFDKISRPNEAGRAAKKQASPSPSRLRFEIAPEELKALSTRPYWLLKRTMDGITALVLLGLSLPIMLAVGGVVVASIGFPAVFWQQRPGLGGRPFRLYKFRTMKAAHGPDGRRLSDEERVTVAGDFLRRTRLDELPQLFNILFGDMSFVGPRPLLHRDQSNAHCARLMVRPGLTGWAQVVGGRDISPADKAALDIWYVRNASLRLDLNIALRTVAMVVRGERISRTLIDNAWRDLTMSGVLNPELTYTAQTALRAPSPSI
jgi:lipopolysaccharide/colanic/teichoic acid biosynthesis glycosyltransferase